MRDIMLDLETLSLRNNAVVVSIGAVQFDLVTGEIGKIFHIGLNVMDQALNGGAIDQSTLNWWSSQSKTAKEKLMKLASASSTNDGLEAFTKWIEDTFKDLNNVRLWGNGVSADNVWIRNLYHRQGVNFCVPYWCDTDVRTLTQLEDYDKVKELTGQFKGVKHDAIDDCTHQVKMCHEAYKLIKGIK